MSTYIPSVAQIFDVLMSGFSQQLQLDTVQHLHIHIDAGCSPDFLRQMRDLLIPESAHIRITLSDATLDADVAIPDIAVLLGSSEQINALVYLYRSHDCPVVIIDEHELHACSYPEDVPCIATARQHERTARLAQWLTSLEGKALLLAAAFPWCRRLVVQDLIGETALENLLIAALPFSKGSHFPLMCANEFKLLYQLMLIHSHKLSPTAFIDGMLIILAGLGVKMTSRKIAGHLPVATPFVEAACAGSGTWLIGQMMALHQAYRHAQSQTNLSQGTLRDQKRSSNYLRS